MLLDLNGYLSFYKHFSTTAVPRMLRGARTFFYMTLFIYIVLLILWKMSLFLYIYTKYLMF